MRDNGKVLRGMFRFQGGQIERIGGRVPELFQPDAQPAEVAQVPVDLLAQLFGLVCGDSHPRSLCQQGGPVACGVELLRNKRTIRRTNDDATNPDANRLMGCCLGDGQRRLFQQRVSPPICVGVRLLRCNLRCIDRGRTHGRQSPRLNWRLARVPPPPADLFTCRGAHGLARDVASSGNKQTIRA